MRLAVGEEPSMLRRQADQRVHHFVPVVRPEGLDLRGAVRDVVAALPGTDDSASLPRIVPAPGGKGCQNKV